MREILFFCIASQDIIIFFLITGMAVLTTCLFVFVGKPFGCWGISNIHPFPLSPSPHRARWCKHLISGTGSSHNTKWPSQVETLEGWGICGAKNFRKKWGGGGVDGCNSYTPPKKNGWKWCASNLWHFPYLIFGGGKDFESFFVDASIQNKPEMKRGFCK